MTNPSINSAGIPIPVPVSQGGTGETTTANALSNLGGLPIAGGTMTGNLILNADPTLPLQAATKEYVDTIASGLVLKAPCICASTGPYTVVYFNGAAGVGATLTNAGVQAAFSSDGVSPTLGQRVLIKDQAAQLQNGIYTVTTVGTGATNWVLTRATDYDTPAQIVPGSYTIIEQGTVNAVTSWIETATITNIGIDPIEFTQFTAGVGANISLSNLTTTSINQSLLPAADVTYNLGAQNLRWTNFYAEYIRTGHTTTNNVVFSAYNTNTSSDTPFITLTAGNPPTCTIASGVTGVTQAALNNSTLLATTAYVDNATGGGAGANVALNNLAAVAINTSLLGGVDGAVNLGSASFRFGDSFVETIKTGTTAGQSTVLEAYNTLGASYVSFFTLTANNPPTAALASSVTGVTQLAMDNSTKLATTAYVDAATGGGAGANVGLTNLSGVAINASLIAGADGTLDLGSPADRWANIYAETSRSGTTAAQTYVLQGYNTNTASWVPYITITSGNPPTCAIAGTVTGVTQLPLNNTTLLATTAYVDAAVSAAGGANKALSNLSAVAINTALLGDADGAINLGSAAFRFGDTFTETIKTGTTAGQSTVLDAYDTHAASYTTFATLTANNPPTMALAGAVTGVTQAASDNSTKLATTAYADAAASAAQAASANRALSNLTGVAINASLIAGGDGTLDLGSAADRWRNILIEAVQTGTTAAQTTLLQAYNTNTAAYVTFATLTANNPPTMALSGSVTGVTQAAGNNSTQLATTAYTDSQLPWAVTKGGTGTSTQFTQYSVVFAGASGVYTQDNANFYYNSATPTLQIGPRGSNAADALFEVYSSTTTVAHFQTTAAQGATGGAIVSLYALSGTAETSGNRLGSLQYGANSDNAGTVSYGAAINAFATENWSNSALGTKLVFNTTPNTTTTRTTALTLDQDQTATFVGSVKPSADNAIDLGTATLRWANAYSHTVRTGTTATNTTLLQAYDTNASSYTTFATLTANNPPTMSLASAVTGTTQTAGDNSTKLATTAYVDRIAPSYPITVANGGTGVSTLTTAYGTLCAGTTATGTVQTVSPGSSGAPLVSGGASALPSYTTLSVGGGGTGLTTATTAYSPICAGTTATGAFQAASTGLSTSGYVFTSNGSSSLPSFQTVGASAAGLILISSGSASNVASVNFDNLLTSTYNNYQIIYNDFVPATNGSYLIMQIGTGSTPTYQATSYTGILFSGANGSAVWGIANTITTGFQIAIGQSNNALYGGGGYINLFNANDSSNQKPIQASSYQTSVTPSAGMVTTGQLWQGATVLTSVKFITSSGNITTGNFYLYGYHK